MARFNSPLDNVRIASPCNADWDQMVGSERARFCGQCNLNVFNLSSMTKDEAELLIGQTEGRLCVRYFQRADGSVLTKDCPVGLRAFRRRMSYVARAVSSLVLTFLAGVGLYIFTQRRAMMGDVVVTGVMAIEPHVLPVPPIQPEEEPVLGMLTEPPPPPKPKVRLGRIRSKN
jgi:hypothetical protein